jgi:hypothetical protein
MSTIILLLRTRGWVGGALRGGKPSALPADLRSMVPALLSIFKALAEDICGGFKQAGWTKVGYVCGHTF